jgi:hypothetical protein
MQQTLLVLLGVVLLGLYGYAQHQRSAEDERAAVRRELEIAALGVAEDWAARARKLDFDEVMVGNDTIRIETHTTGLTAKASLGSEAGEICEADDLDDLHGHIDTTRYPVRFGEADFRVTIAVDYVQRVTAPDTALVSAPSPTNTKAIQITARYLEPADLAPPGHKLGRTFRDTVFARTNLVLTNAALTLRRKSHGANAIDFCASP